VKITHKNALGAENTPGDLRRMYTNMTNWQLSKSKRGKDLVQITHKRCLGGFAAVATAAGALGSRYLTKTTSFAVP
jgi:hypothetical protein